MERAVGMVRSGRVGMAPPMAPAGQARWSGRAARGGPPFVASVRPPVATVVVDTAHLQAEMEARGVTGRDLAKEAGISEGTIYNALHGRPILLRNAKLIAGALQRVEVDPALARLVLVGRPGAA